MQPVFRFAVNGSALRSVRLALCSQRSRTVNPCGRNRPSSLSSHSALNKYRQQRSLAISALSTCSLTSKPILLLGHVDAMLSRSSDPHRWWCSGLWIADCKRIHHCLAEWQSSHWHCFFRILLPSPLHFQHFYSVSHDRTYVCGGNLRAGTGKETELSITAIEEALSLLLILLVPGLKLCESFIFIETSVILFRHSRET